MSVGAPQGGAFEADRDYLRFVFGKQRMIPVSPSVPMRSNVPSKIISMPFRPWRRHSRR
jgi:hypothetical protein